MNTVIYSTTLCPYCKMLKGYLTEQNIPFTEKLIDQQITAQEEMITLSDGYTGTPFVVITKDDGTQVKIQGFDKEKVDEALGLN